MRKYSWYISTFFRKHGFVIVMSLLTTIIGFSLFIPFAATRFNPKPRVYVGLVGNYTLANLPKSVKNLVSIGLTKLEPDGSVSPGLASRWLVENDGSSYRFVINKDFIWQDGKKLEPSDINYPFSDVEVISTVNDIVFKLPDPYSPFPNVVSEPILKSVTSPFLYFFKREKIIGLGDYSIINYTTNGQRVKQVTLDGPHEIRDYRFYITEQDALDAFKKGEVDVLQDINEPSELANWPNVQIVEESHPERYLAVFFDLNNPKFAKNIRQGLAYGLHKPTDERRAIGPINPQSWAYLEGGKTYAYDLPRAIERFLSEIPEINLEIELTTTPAFTARAEQIKQDWETLGDNLVEACQTSSSVKEKNVCSRLDIVVNIKISNFPDTTNFEALLVGQESPSDPDQYYLWHSQQSTNFTGYKNTRIDSLLEKGRQETDYQARKTTYQEFQQFLLEDSPAIFLEHIASYTIARQ